MSRRSKLKKMDRSHETMQQTDHESCRTFFTLPLLSQTATAPAAGNGSAADPYQIANLENLYWIGQDTSRFNEHYIQTANIDASPTATWDWGKPTYDPEEESVYRGFYPIGHAYGFTGDYDGNNYTIDSLCIHRGSFCALFEMTNQASLKNIRMTKSKISGGQWTAALVGSASDTDIENVFADGHIYGSHLVGGIIGASNNSRINNSHSSADISGSSLIGGLIGFAENNSELSHCYSTGRITDASTGGGLIGQCEDSEISMCRSACNVVCNHSGGLISSADNTTISYSYSSGSVTGNMTGGFIELIQNSNINNCYSRTNTVTDTSFHLTYYTARGFACAGNSTISNCYSCGSISDDYYYRYGFIGDLGTVSLNDCFWNNELCNATASDAGTGKCCSEMRMPSTYQDAGWNFTTIWEIDAAENNSYPILLSLKDDPPLPITLGEFSLNNIQDHIIISWSTESETENLCFILYKNDLELARIEGAGSSSEPHAYSYRDNMVLPGHSYVYRLSSLDYGNREKTCAQESILLDVNPLYKAENLQLESIYPNPFNPNVTIEFSLIQNEHVSFSIYNSRGCLLERILNSTLNAGEHSIRWHADAMPSGIYILQINTESTQMNRKLLLMK